MPSVWISSIAVSPRATSSASVDDMVMQCWRRDALLIPAPARKMTNPVVDRHSDQLESARALSV
eukprot:5275347-Prymnesium_polylepis.2